MTAQSRRLTSVHTALLATLVALATAPFVYAEQTKAVFNGETANLGAYDGSCAWMSVSISRNKTTAGTRDVHRILRL